MRPNSITLLCAVCGTPIKVKPSMTKTKRGKYCSRTCFYKGNKGERIPLTERFWNKVNTLGDCWIWTGFRDREGYGRIKIGKSAILAHRLSWEIHNGSIPDEMDVLHTCDQPSCVNPTHLRIGTHYENMQDMKYKGRAASGDRSGQRKHPERTARGERHGSRTKPEARPKGESHYFAKLTEQKVREIRQRHSKGDIQIKELAREYGVTDNTIICVVYRRTWKHVD